MKSLEEDILGVIQEIGSMSEEQFNLFLKRHETGDIAVMLANYGDGEDPFCPVCDGMMHLIYGCGWDYDTWICDDPGCDGKIELETSTGGDE